MHLSEKMDFTLVQNLPGCSLCVIPNPFAYDSIYISHSRSSSAVYGTPWSASESDLHVRWEAGGVGRIP